MDDHGKCDACLGSAVIISYRDARAAEPYRLCPTCKERMDLKALRPIEWYRLASRHGWWQYELHDDFYDEDGWACGFGESRLIDSQFLAPTLAQSLYSVDALFGYCMTCHTIREETFASFGMFPVGDVLTELRRHSRSANSVSLEVALSVAENALGPDAADWVREAFAISRQRYTLSPWAGAAAKCLPPPEGLNAVIDALAKLDGACLASQIGCLSWFRSAEVLKWIEQRCPEKQVNQHWGQLAAVSDFSWDTAYRWLSAGRPLSLVAVDALVEMVPAQNRAFITRKLKPSLRGSPSHAEIRQALVAYQAQDDVPRVMRRCEFLLDTLEQIPIA